MVLRYSPGFYPFSSPSPSTHSGPSPILAQIPYFRHSPGFHLFGTRPNSTLSQYSPGPFSSTRPDSTFSALTRILPFPDTHSDPFSALARIPPFRHLPRFYHFRYLPRFHIFSTLLDSTLSQYSLGPFSGTRPDSTFPALARILPFPDTHLDPSPILARIPPFWHSPGFYPFPILIRTLLRHSS